MHSGLADTAGPKCAGKEVGYLVVAADTGQSTEQVPPVPCSLDSLVARELGMEHLVLAISPAGSGTQSCSKKHPSIHLSGPWGHSLLIAGTCPLAWEGLRWS